MGDNLTTPEELNEQVKEIKKIVNDLITISDDGTVIAKKGTTKEQLLYAIQELEKIKVDFTDFADRREQFNKTLDEHFANYEKVRASGRKLLNKHGEGFFPTWYKKFLNF